MFETNDYFEGNVKSIAFKTATLPATVGVMAVGNYLFNTADKEAVTVVSGAMTIQLVDTDEKKTYGVGETFNVPANSAFNVSIQVETAYLCLYG